MKLNVIISYRQSINKSIDKNESNIRAHPQVPGFKQQQQSHKNRDLIDSSWKLLNVPNGDISNSMTVQNLSQDTSYDFYVRARNIIGEGPRSSIVQATTKRAPFGIQFIDQIDDRENAQASSLGKFISFDQYSWPLLQLFNPLARSLTHYIYTPQYLPLYSISFYINTCTLSIYDSFSLSIQKKTKAPSNDQTVASILDTSVLNSSSVVGIIHLVDLSTVPSSSSELNLSTLPDSSTLVDDSQTQSPSEMSMMNSSKMIKILMPVKQQQQQPHSTSNNMTTVTTGALTNKRPRMDQTNSSQTQGTFLLFYSFSILFPFLSLLSLDLHIKYKKIQFI